MTITIASASMARDPEEGYRGSVVFQVEGHPKPYEVSLFSGNGSDWDYSLHFAAEPGKEEHIAAVEEALENDDDLFDTLLDAARDRENRAD